MSGILHGPQNSFYCCRRQVRHGKHFTHLSILYIILLNNTHRTLCSDGNAPMIKRMRHNMMFYVHYLPCCITHSFKRQIRYKQENQKKKETHWSITVARMLQRIKPRRWRQHFCPKLITHASKQLTHPKRP